MPREIPQVLIESESSDISEYDGLEHEMFAQ